jgi:hypothetical protein
MVKRKEYITSNIVMYYHYQICTVYNCTLSVQSVCVQQHHHKH